MALTEKDAIRKFMAETGCRRENRANIYLQQCGNNVEAAIELYLTHHEQPKMARETTTGPKRPKPDIPSHISSTISRATSSSSGRSAPSSTERWPVSPTLPGSELDIPSRSHIHSQQTSTSSLPLRPSSSSEVISNAESISSLPEPDSVMLSEPDTTEGKEAVLDTSEWNFKLPVVQNPPHMAPGLASNLQFSTRSVIVAIQDRVPYEQIRDYFGHHGRTNMGIIKSQINDAVEGFPPIFFATATNNENLIRLFAKFGANVDSVVGIPPVPLLAFAVMYTKQIQAETTMAVATLLSLGADALVIPRAFFFPFHLDLHETGPEEEELDDLDDPRREWCRNPDMRSKLAEALNLTQRYQLEKSSRLTKASERQLQIAQRNNCEALFGVPYFMIGQTAATSLLQNNLLHYMLRRQIQPLVLVFAGPSGHGKTELARRLGALLNLELHVSDCTIVTRENELFGPRKPYVGAEEGSPLNNFLARKSGQRCIVFLDEFEKTTMDIWNALLIPFDKGEYQDRRTLKTVNCSKTIWIIATNALDENIMQFCKRNNSIFDEDEPDKRELLLEDLEEVMKDRFKELFKPPLTGRISAFIPFLPFSPPETYVGAHKYLLELMGEVSRPVNTSFSENEQLLGDINLKIRHDANVCRILSQGYDPELGIRSLKKSIREKVATQLDTVYMATQDPIVSGAGMKEYELYAYNNRIKIKPM